MQGQPPQMMASSPFGSPPIKKQRANAAPDLPPTNNNSNRPVVQPVMSQRRAQLLKLQQTNINNPNVNNPNTNTTTNHQPLPPLSASTLMNQARSSLMMAPPLSMATTTTTTTNSSYLQAAANGGPPTSAFQESNHTNKIHPGTNSRTNLTMNGATTTTTGIRQPGSALRGGGRPGGATGGATGGPPPTSNSMLYRHPNPNSTTATGSTIAATTTATTTNTPPSPKPAIFWNPNSPVSPQSTTTAAAVVTTTTATVHSPESTATVSANTTATTASTTTTTTTTAAVADARLARRLEFAQKTTNIPTPSRAKSAPPTRKQPPPPPPPRAQEEPVKNVVSFLPSPPLQAAPEETTTSIRPETPELTKGGEGTPVTPANTLHAGFTPAPPKNLPQPSLYAGSTPFPRAILATPTTLDKQAMLQDLLDVADTPQSSNTSTSYNTTNTNMIMTNGGSDGGASPELRLQQQLASTTKEKADALKKVSQLEGQLANLIKTTTTKESSNNNVKFRSSPILGTLEPPKKRYPKSPCPKRMSSILNNRSSAAGGEQNAEQEMLRAAAASVPFEFTLDEQTYIIRRPYGLATEQDLWLKVGQLNVKVYAQSANVEDETSLEVATTCANGSILNLYGSYFIRHHTIDEGPNDYEEEQQQSLMKPLGNILYVDDNGVDQQYNLDDIWSTAMTVRGLYRTSLRAAADALLLQRMTPSASSSTTTTTSLPTTPEPANGATTTTKKTTVDTGMTTDPMPKVAVAVEAAEELSSDPFLGVLMRFVVSSLFSLIFFCVKTFILYCIRMCIMLIVLVGVSIVHLHFQDTYNTFDEMGAIARAYTNHNGLV